MRARSSCEPQIHVIPAINFRYFTDGADEDISAVAEGVRFARRLTAPSMREGLIAEKELPGALVQSDAEIAQFVRDKAWGHDASSTCAIGASRQDGVLDSDFRVYGTQGLRVADASVFPRTPGPLMVGAVYMVAEKAAGVILRDAKAIR